MAAPEGTVCQSKLKAVCSQQGGTACETCALSHLKVRTDGHDQVLTHAPHPSRARASESWGVWVWVRARVCVCACVCACARLCVRACVCVGGPNHVPLTVACVHAEQGLRVHHARGQHLLQRTARSKAFPDQRRMPHGAPPAPPLTFPALFPKLLLPSQQSSVQASVYASVANCRYPPGFFANRFLRRCVGPTSPTAQVSSPQVCFLKKGPPQVKAPLKVDCIVPLGWKGASACVCACALDSACACVCARVRACVCVSVWGGGGGG